MVGFCLFGAGLIGTVHAANLAAHPDAELRTVVDINAAAGQKLAAKHGAVYSDDPEAAIGGDMIDAVLIASDGRTHADLAIPAARAGKAIFCEKPLDLDLGRAEDLAREVEAAGVPFQIGFHRRFDTHVGALRAAVDSGEVGRVELV
jgi:myo-inositol 2-dehydrogenase/D-chiro-inositol 1-dehydrogenase